MTDSVVGEPSMIVCIYSQKEISQWPLHGLFAGPNTLTKRAVISKRARLAGFVLLHLYLMWCLLTKALVECCLTTTIVVLVYLLEFPSPMNRTAYMIRIFLKRRKTEVGPEKVPHIP